ncbi:MAG: VTT domain-containing protein [Pseudomonadota bacterium]|nr:VTT domain-containing protein [Pseudomonadota bacterium]
MTTDGIRPRLFAALGVALFLLLLALTWRFTPLGQWLELEALRQGIESIRQQPLAPVLLLVIFIVACLLMVPVTALNIAMILVFGPWLGFAYAMTGTLGAALAGYTIGAWLGKTLGADRLNNRFKAIGEQIERNGLLAIATVRIVPVAPFAVINLVGGSYRIRLWDYILGTLFGMGPGIAALAFFADRLRASLQDPNWQTVASLVFAGICFLLLVFGLNRLVLRYRANASEQTES